jgi:S1-C subfamily serine protease
VQQIDPSVAVRYDLPVEWGAFVVKVGSNTPAEQAGILPGDIIVRISEALLDEDTIFINALFNYQPGDLVEIEVVRNGVREVLQVRLIELK